jgi:hypothetical protein
MGKRRRSLSGARALAVALAVGCAPAPDTSTTVRSPSLRFADLEHDFGHVRQGTTVRHEYTLLNAGDLALRIGEMRAACGCTAVASSAESIPGDGTGAVRATFDTSRYFGEVQRTITVASNDPERPLTFLKLHGVVDLEVAVDPPAVYLGRLRRGARADRAARIVRADDSRVRVRVAGSEGGIIRATLAGEDLHLAVRADAPLGPFEDSVLLLTTSQQLAQIDVPVGGIVEEADAP